MLTILKSLRSVLSLLGVGLWFVPCGFVIRFLVLPAALVWPRQRPLLISVYMKTVITGIFALLRAGGARVRRAGSIPTATPALVVMNHQSLLDICQVTLLAQPYVPAFVTRARYARFIPLVSPSIRLLGCPIVDPDQDPKGAVRTIQNAARELEHGLLIFPEGHRTPDGEILPFHAAGLRIVLGARRLPVFVVVTDGFWEARRFVDVLFKVYRIDGNTEVLGPFESPADEAGIPEFIERLRNIMTERLQQMRVARAPAPQAQPVPSRSA
jgi:1-acyl-sn-glycerol-3-phosphate acyltransferase